MRALAGETLAAEELLIETEAGWRTLLACAAPVRLARGRRGAIAVFRDVTGLKTAMRMREKWISVIAHELRQPLGALSISLQMLGRAADGRHAPETLAHMRSAVGRLDRMIDDLLDKTLVDTRKIKLLLATVDLERLAADVVGRAEDLLRGCTVRIDARRDGPLAVAGDADRIEQVFLNLLSNAAKYGTPRGEIVVRLVPLGREVSVSVTNGGAGLTPEEQRRVFERGYRTDSSRAGAQSGLGLGLYIARGLVQAQGGRIWVESRPGETTFYFTLPVAPESVARALSVSRRPAS